VNYEHAFPRISRHQKMCDIMEVDITEVKMYLKLLRKSWKIITCDQLDLETLGF
jgi:hypothetical protein